MRAYNKANSLLKTASSYHRQKDNRYDFFKSLFKWLLFLTFTIPMTLSANNLTITGTILNNKTNEPLAYVNVAVEGTYYGSVSNENGRFKLVIPDKLENNSISFSAIGFESKSIPINKISWNITVKMAPAEYMIGEVTVMPDSTLRTLLKRAYEKIPENYPDFPTRSSGFYRECVKQKDAGYLYISEAILDVYKTSYKNDESGQVKIVKSRKNIAPGSDTINPVRFYGGIHYPHYIDLVKNRASILKPSKKYKYILKGQEIFNEKEVYCISFSPKEESKKGITGKFYIDKETLAYLKFEYNSNDVSIAKNEKGNPINGIVFLGNLKTINYGEIDGRYYLKSAFTKQAIHNKKTGYFLDISSEYIQTKITAVRAEPIPYEEQASLSTVISEKAEEYEISNWKDYTILENESVQTAFVNMQQADSLLKQVNKPTKQQVLGKFLKIIFRIEFETNLTAYPFSTVQGNYLLQHNLPDSRQLKFATDYEKDLNSLHLEFAIKYKLTKNLKLLYLESDGLLSSEKSKFYFGGLEYEIPLKTYGKKIFCSASAGYGFLKFMQSMGTIENPEAFNFEGKNFDSKEIEAFRGIELNGPRLGADLSFQISNFLYLKIYGGWQFNLNQTEKIRIEEKDDFFMSGKSAENGLISEGTNLYFNGEKILSSQLKFENYFFGIGLKFSY
ncbi:MAG: carboxypeptidase-like regulatory domain-containing protein [Prolixibacteraceae bacterium]|nr:carboxypeptidase-like regulatory domain-containing protein [Prolixibacteraceae bacterium]